MKSDKLVSKIMNPKCSKCGDTDWLLEKDECRSYYAKVTEEPRWIEETKRKKVSKMRVVCAKCGGVSEDVSDMDVLIKEKPKLKVIWQTRMWDKFMDKNS